MGEMLVHAGYHVTEAASATRESACQIVVADDLVAGGKERHYA
jgi:hypothetical protein